MTKSRLEAFSDGVIAILITVMVLELHTPSSPDLSGLLEVVPTIFLYALSFIYLGIYWNNHHHLLHVTNLINGTVLWANLHLLFKLSLIPFGSAGWAKAVWPRCPPRHTAAYYCSPLWRTPSWCDASWHVSRRIHTWRAQLAPIERAGSRLCCT